MYQNNNPNHALQDVLQAGMHIPSGSLSQMTEEEHVRIAKRIGLIQHLPVGYYDGTGSRRSHETDTKDSSKTTTTTEISNSNSGSNTNNQFNLTITEEAVCSEFSSFCFYFDIKTIIGSHLNATNVKFLYFSNYFFRKRIFSGQGRGLYDILHPVLEFPIRVRDLYVRLPIGRSHPLPAVPACLSRRLY